MFDRLPTPYGLVRAGVAPDHQKIKAVTAAFDKVAGHPRFRFFGGVELGKHVNVADLRAHYHQIVYTTGAQTDRRMGIPGEDLPGSHPATEFVAWYNGHPDYRDCQFDLTQERVAVVGVGNVAIDVARILCRTPEELDEDRHRRARAGGPAGTAGCGRSICSGGAARPRPRSPIRRSRSWASWPTPTSCVMPEEVELDELSRASLEQSRRPRRLKKVEILQSLRARAPAGKRPRQLVMRFLVSPVALLDDAAAPSAGIRLVRNRLVASATGTIQAKADGAVRGAAGRARVPLGRLSRRAAAGRAVRREVGRRAQREGARARPGHQASRDRASTRRAGSSAAPTRRHRHQQARRGRDGARRCSRTSPPATRWQPTEPDPAAAGAAGAPAPAPVRLVRRLAAAQRARGRARARARGGPALKFTRVDEMLAALGNRGPR